MLSGYDGRRFLLMSVYVIKLVGCYVSDNQLALNNESEFHLSNSAGVFGLVFVFWEIWRGLALSILFLQRGGPVFGGFVFVKSFGVF